MKMTQQPNEVMKKRHNDTGTLPYETPAVIYEGLITTRAGSPTGGTDSDNAVDPADLFGG